MFRLTSKITIGKYSFGPGVNEVTIRRSVHDPLDTAIIKLPGVGRVNGQAVLDSSVETSTLWKEGDPVNINLGYNGDLNIEFRGFVRCVSPSVPIIIECEGYGWQLRRKQITGSWKSIKLVDFLKILTEGTDILLSPYIPDLTLTNFPPTKQPNGLEMLNYLKNNCHLTAYFQFNALYVGVEEAIPGNKVYYRLGWNCIRDNKLKYRVADDTKVLVQVMATKGKNAKAPIVKVGDPGGSIVKKHIANINDVSKMTAIANRLLSLRKYTGYEGQISGFLQPYCNLSDTAVVIDKKYKVMGGSYFVDGLEVTYSTNGARRNVHISKALSTPQFIPLQDKNSNQ